MGHAEGYYELKKDWVAKCGEYRCEYEPYTQAEGGFIDSVTAKARLELQSR